MRKYPQSGLIVEVLAEINEIGQARAAHLLHRRVEAEIKQALINWRGVKASQTAREQRPEPVVGDTSDPMATQNR